MEVLGFWYHPSQGREGEYNCSGTMWCIFTPSSHSLSHLSFARINVFFVCEHVFPSALPSLCSWKWWWKNPCELWWPGKNFGNTIILVHSTYFLIVRSVLSHPPFSSFIFLWPPSLMAPILAWLDPTDFPTSLSHSAHKLEESSRAAMFSMSYHSHQYLAHLASFENQFLLCEWLVFPWKWRLFFFSVYPPWPSQHKESAAAAVLMGTWKESLGSYS